MRIQNNVNYNNPAFGTKLKVVGPEDLMEKFRRVLMGGKFIQGEKELIRYMFHGDKDLVLIGKTDVDAYSAWWTKSQEEDGGVLNQKVESFFDDAPILDLTKPLKIALEGAQEAVARLARLIKDGFHMLDETPVEVIPIPQSGKTYLAIGNEATAVMQSRQLRVPESIILGNLSKNITPIHVTE